MLLGTLVDVWQQVNPYPTLAITEDDTKESSPDTLQDYVLSKEEVKAEMDKLIKSKAVFVVGKSYCPYTKKAKQVLKYGKKYEPI